LETALSEQEGRAPLQPGTGGVGGKAREGRLVGGARWETSKNKAPQGLTKKAAIDLGGGKEEGPGKLAT